MNKEDYAVYFTKLSPLAKMPHHGSDEAAGYDLYSANEEAVYIRPNEVKLIPTGLAIQLPPKTFGALYPRSGLALKHGLRLANCVGVVDADYRGQVGVPIYNDSNDVQIITPGERIAQIIIQPYYPVEFVEVTTLPSTNRGEGGFGHSGLK